MGARKTPADTRPIMVIVLGKVNRMAAKAAIAQHAGTDAEVHYWEPAPYYGETLKDEAEWRLHKQEVRATSEAAARPLADAVEDGLMADTHRFVFIVAAGCFPGKTGFPHVALPSEAFDCLTYGKANGHTIVDVPATYRA